MTSQKLEQYFSSLAKDAPDQNISPFLGQQRGPAETQFLWTKNQVALKSFCFSG
jgi:hypothetical protein